MEVEIIKVKDQLRTINRIIFHLDSKDKTKAIQGQRRSTSFEDQVLSYMAENKRILNLYEQKFAEIDVFQANTNASLKKPGNSNGVASPNLAKSIHGFIP